MRFAIARWVMHHRVIVLLLFVAATAFFMTGLKHVEIRTVFNDLLPANDPYVQVYFCLLYTSDAADEN